MNVVNETQSPKRLW